jgi:hypothetical protein
MDRKSLTQYDEYPTAMLDYLRHYGPHFNKKLCEFAVSNMFTEENGKEVQLKPYTKQQVDNLLTTYKVKVKNNKLYDATYVANMCKADYAGSSVPSEEHIAKYIKDTLDDPDGAEGLTFNRWIADMKWIGVPIPWEDFL